jgi:cobalt-zinc-cadmium efflux system outer membrane protein
MNRFPFLVFLFLTASTAAPAADLTLADALDRVESRHPWLRTRASTTAVASARVAAAEARPPAELSLEFENALGSGELRAARSLETTLQFSRAFDFGHRRDARAATATALNDAERLAWEERRRELLAETTRRFIRVAAAQAHLTAAREFVDLSRETLDAVQTRTTRAAATVADLARARLAFANAELAAEHAEHLLLSARHSLASLWGADAADFNLAAADLTHLPATAPYETLVTRISGTPTQARYAALARWRRAQENLALANAGRGDPRWAAGLRRVEAGDDFGLVLGLSYAWPAAQRSHAEAAEARVEHDRTAAEAESALHESRTTLFGLYQELHHARIEHDAARDTMIPAAETWLSAIEAGATAGRYGLRDIGEARDALFAARQRRISAAAEYHTSLVASEQLIGGPASPETAVAP